MQPMVGAQQGWAGQPRWQQYPTPNTGGGSMYWPGRSGFLEAPRNSANNGVGAYNNNTPPPHSNVRSASFRVPTSNQQPQVSPPQLGYLPRHATVPGDEEPAHLPPIPTTASSSHIHSSAANSHHSSFRQQAAPMNRAGSIHGSFRRMPSGYVSNNAPMSSSSTSFRQPPQQAPIVSASASSPIGASHLAPLASPVAAVPSAPSPTQSEGLEQEKLEIQKELSQLMGRKMSSKRVLRRRVSFQGIRLTEEERRLQAELQRLREEEERRSAAERELKEQRQSQQQQQQPQQYPQQQQQQPQQQYPQHYPQQPQQQLQQQQQQYQQQQQQKQQQQYQLSPQYGAYETGGDSEQPPRSQSHSPTPPVRYSTPQPVPPQNAMALRQSPATPWGAYGGAQVPPQQMYNMYYGGQLPPVARFPQQNGFPMNCVAPQMMGMYPQQQQAGRRF